MSKNKIKNIFTFAILILGTCVSLATQGERCIFFLLQNLRGGHPNRAYEGICVGSSNKSGESDFFKHAIRNIDLKEQGNVVHLWNCRTDNIFMNIIKANEEGLFKEVENLPYFDKNKFTPIDFLLEYGSLMLSAEGNYCVYCINDQCFWCLDSCKKCCNGVTKLFGYEGALEKSIPGDSPLAAEIMKKCKKIQAK